MRQHKTGGAIVTLPQAVRIAARMRRAGKRVVTANGSFDLMHAGHARFLSAARRCGDALMVLVNSDDSVRAYKGPGRPIIPCVERMKMLAALASVDYVLPFDDLVPNGPLSKIRPAVHCNAADWGRGCVEQSVVENGGGKIRIIPLVSGVSTSGIVEKIFSTPPAPKAVILDRDGVINADGSGYTHTRRAFVFLPGALVALRRLARTPYRIVIASNQSGIGRGYFTARQMEHLHRWMRAAIVRAGGRIDAVYHCPHHPRDGCSCRKPEVGLLRRAAKDLGLSLNGSWLVGDSPSDVVAGRMANVKTIKIGERMPKATGMEPHHYARDLRAAVGIILRHGSQ